MSRERRAEIIRRTRYMAAGMVENFEVACCGQFDDLTDDERELVLQEMQRIGKRIYKEPSQ